MMNTELQNRVEQLPTEAQNRVTAGLRLLVQFEEKRSQMTISFIEHDNYGMGSSEVTALKELRERLNALF